MDAPRDLALEVYQKISGLTSQSPFAKKEQEEFFFELSFGLRHYLELQRKLPVTDQTFREFEQTLKAERKLPAELKEKILAFLKKAEFIKFAHKLSSEQEALNLKSDVLSWMDELKRITDREEEARKAQQDSKEKP